MIIADDAADGRVDSIVAGAAGLEVRVVETGSANIAIARNATLDAATGDWLAFVDDDTEPDPDWLRSFLDTVRRNRADGGVGRVVACLPHEAPSVFAKARTFDHWPGESGVSIRTGWTSNAIVRREKVLAMRLRFDEERGRTGGEDTEFFASFAAGGGRLVACPEAVVRERVPVERARLAYVRARALRHGYDYAHSTRLSMGRITRLAVPIRSVAKIIAFAPSAVATRAFAPALSLWFRSRYWLAFGELRAFAGPAPAGPYRLSREAPVATDRGGEASRPDTA